MPLRTARRTTSAALLVLMLAACTSSKTAAKDPGPTVADFTDGPCRIAAPAVLALRKAARQLPSAPGVVAPAVQQAVITAQDQLLPSSTGTDALGKAALSMVQEAGFVRLQAVGSSYDPGTGKTLLADIDAYIVRCTTLTPTPS